MTEVSTGYTWPSRSNVHYLFLTFGHSGAQGWAPECPNVRNYKCTLDLHVLNTLRCNHLSPLRFKWLRINPNLTKLHAGVDCCISNEALYIYRYPLELSIIVLWQMICIRFGFRAVRSQYFTQNGINDVLSLLRLHSAVDRPRCTQLQ